MASEVCGDGQRGVGQNGHKQNSSWEGEVVQKAVPRPRQAGKGRGVISNADDNLAHLGSRLGRQDSQPCPFHREVISFSLVPARRWAAGGSRRLVLRGCARPPLPPGSAPRSVCS